MNKDNRTDPKVAYWLRKYLLLQGSVHMANLGPMSLAFAKAAQSQDVIVWRETTYGMLLKEFQQLQATQCRLSLCIMNGDE